MLALAETNVELRKTQEREEDIRILCRRLSTA